MLFNHSEFSVAVYLRLSREDGDKIESDSIANQRLLIQNYLVDKPYLQFVNEYVDDGYSGSDFERPGFCKMMEDINRQKINCIVVKDLSRFGRNYIEVGRYIERKFPAMGIRFIAVNDKYDNAKEPEDAEQIIVPFKNLINDAYCRDISVKIRTQLDVKRKSGKFIGSFAAYGYAKDPADKNHLIVDECAAEVVRQIFQMKLDGYSAMGIAEKLNRMAVPTPMEYKRMCGYNYMSGFRTAAKAKWCAKSVLRILQNELYTGVMIQGKKQKINYKIKKSRDIPPDEWIKVDNTHEAIIPKPYFERVQEVMRLYTRTAPKRENVYAFSGLVQCGICGRNMIQHSASKNGKIYRYLCCSDRKSEEACGADNISEESLMTAVRNFAKGKLELLFNACELSDNAVSVQNSTGLKLLNVRLARLAKDEEHSLELIERLKSDMASGVISDVEYADCNRQFTAKLNETRKAKAEAEAQKKRLSSKDFRLYHWLEEFKKIDAAKPLTRKETVILINKIIVFGKNSAEIHLNCEDEINELIQQAENQRQKEAQA